MKKPYHSYIVPSRSRRRGQALLVAILLMIIAAMLGSTFVIVIAHQVTSQTI